MIPKQNKERMINTNRLVRSAMNDEDYCSFILDCLHQEQSGNGMIIWRHVKKLTSFKATDGLEYVVAKSKKEMDQSLPIYIGVGNKLVKTRRYEIIWLDAFFQ